MKLKNPMRLEIKSKYLVFLEISRHLVIIYIKVSRWKQVVNNVLPKVTVFPRVNFLHLAKKLSVRDRVAALEKRLKDTAAIDDIVDFGTSKLTPANGSTFILSI